MARECPNRTTVAMAEEEERLQELSDSEKDDA